MQYFPLFVNTQSLNVLIIGGGEVASRKLDLLARTKAHITLIAPDVTQDVVNYSQAGRITLLKRKAAFADIANIDLLYLATADEQLNIEYANLAKSKGIWANVVDNPTYCQFITPSIVDRGKLVVAISTAGAAPVFARTIRSRLETLLPASLAPLFDFVASKREEVQQKLTDGKSRRLFWERFFNLNQDRFDSQTPDRYQQAFVGGHGQGEILILADTSPAHLLPVGIMSAFQKLDVVMSSSAIDLNINELLRRDARREPIAKLSEISKAYQQGERLLLIVEPDKIAELTAHFPMAKHIQPGAI